MIAYHFNHVHNLRFLLKPIPQSPKTPLRELLSFIFGRLFVLLILKVNAHFASTRHFLSFLSLLKPIPLADSDFTVLLDVVFVDG